MTHKQSFLLFKISYLMCRGNAFHMLLLACNILYVSWWIRCGIWMINKGSNQNKNFHTTNIHPSNTSASWNVVFLQDGRRVSRSNIKKNKLYICNFSFNQKRNCLHFVKRALYWNLFGGQKIDNRYIIYIVPTHWPYSQNIKMVYAKRHMRVVGSSIYIKIIMWHIKHNGEVY